VIVTRLKLANVRAIDVAEFRFQPGFNLIVGVNGVGKTSVLDSLGVCLSAVVKHMNKLRNPVESFNVDDIRVGAETLTVECEVRIRESTHTYLVHKPLEKSVPQKKKIGMPREQVLETPERAEFEGDPPKITTGKEPEGRPLAVLFSTRRAVPSERAPARGTASGGIFGAYAEAFKNRELRLSEFAAWVRVQQKLSRETPFSQRILDAFDHAVTRFLPEYSNLRANNEKKPKLLIDHGECTLQVRQLSDGERGILAMVLDLTRRLAQANPHVSDPAQNVEAIVLIDEIDLHLHPAWQRKIIGNLITVFPKCQFIATTHSPQVIGEIEHDRIQIIAEGPVYSPTHSFGVDSSRVLEEIMEVVPRSEAVDNLLHKLSGSIRDGKYRMARRLLVDLATQVGEHDPEVTRAQSLLEFMEDKE
jgi:predicted ATP-binding protein involved in virulence